MTLYVTENDEAQDGKYYVSTSEGGRNIANSVGLQAGIALAEKKIRDSGKIGDIIIEKYVNGQLQQEVKHIVP